MVQDAQEGSLVGGGEGEALGLAQPLEQVGEDVV